MKKFLLSLMAFVLASTAVSAQSIINSNAMKADRGLLQSAQRSFVAAPNGVKKSPAKITLPDNQTIMGNYTSDTYATAEMGLGFGMTATLRIAAFIPCEAGSKFDGCTVKSIRFALANAAKVSKVFIMKVTTDGNFSEEVVSQTLTNTNAQAGWTNVELDTPYTLDAEGLKGYLVGYYYNQVNKQYPLSIVEEGKEYCESFIYGNLGQGTRWYNMGTDYGNLSVQCIVEKEGGFPDYALGVGHIENAALAMPGGNYNISAKIYNEGKKLPESYTIGISFDDKELKEISSSELVMNDGVANLETSITIPEDATLTTHTISLYAKTINGAEPTEGIKKTSVTVTVVEQIYPRKVVVEEGTGTWCGWCVRGIVAVEKMYKEFPDNFIAIAVHSDDAMANAVNYSTLLNYFEGFPSCITNRLQKYIGDPNEEDLRMIIKAEKDLGLAQIEATADWTDDTKKSVKVNTTTRFATSNNNANVKIAYVVTENGVGPYVQSNYYAGGGYGEMDGWERKGSKVKTIFNDVARGIYNYKGITGSVPTVINMGEDYDYEYTVTLPSNVKNADNVNIITLLIDNKTGEILNADMVKASNFVSGINGVTTDDANATESVRYNASGQVITAPQHGLNIIKMSNGSVKKVIVK